MRNRVILWLCVETYHPKSLYNKTIFCRIFLPSLGEKVAKATIGSSECHIKKCAGKLSDLIAWAGPYIPNRAKDKRADHKDFESSVEHQPESRNKGMTPVLTTSDGFNARPQGTCGNKAVTRIPYGIIIREQIIPPLVSCISGSLLNRAKFATQLQINTFTRSIPASRRWKYFSP